MQPEAVVATARAALRDEPMLADALANPRVALRGDALVWTVGTMTMDAGATVEVDDATGEVSRVELHRRPRG